MNPPAALFTRLSFYSCTFFACIVLCGWSPPATAQTGKMALAFPVNALTVDGDLADWPTDLIRYPLLHNDEGAPLLGPADFQGYFVVAYNETENALYVGADIQDDNVVRQGSEGDPWNSQDSCELYLFGHKPGQHNPTQYSIRGDWPPSIFGPGSMDEMQTAIGWRQDGYSCEWRIDITRASGGQVRLQPDVEWGFDLSIWDRDLKGDNSWIAWSRGIGKYRRTDRLGTLAAMRTDASLNEIVARIGTISDKRDHLPGISGSVAGYQMFFSGVLMAITFLHLLLFLFNRETRANLFYAFYTAAIGAAIFSGLQMEFYSYMDPDSIRAAQKLTLLFISLFGLAFLYSLFGPVPRRFYFELGLVILPAAISSISFIVFSQESNVALGFASGIRGLLGLLIALASGLILLETILVLFRSVRRGLEGAWIIGAGFVIFTTNISSLVYKTETEFSALYWVLIPLISMSVLLARRVGKTHQELKTRLFQVEQLSAKTQQQYEQIEQQNLQIQEANRLKSDFLARMSHDLRTPMNAIIGYTRILLRKTRDVLDDRHYKNLENVNLSAHKLLVLINDILDLSKIEAGRIDIKVEPVNLKTLAQECATSIESLLKPGVELRYELADVPPFHTDADRLHRALMNLLGNAVKFTHQGSITVALRPHNDGIELSVIDTGEGIPQKDLPHIFDEFRQVDASNGARHEGTGLGLAIVKKSVELLAGSVTVESEEGVGSRFTLWIKDYPQNGT